MPRILLVEDEEEVLSSLVAYFAREGFDVVHARGGYAALSVAATARPDIAVLDVMLHEGPEGPDGMDGFQVLAGLRREGYTGPVIFLTARTLERDKLVAFDLGADDYVTKPFSLRELQARVGAVLKRVGGVRSVYRFGDVEVDLDNYLVRRGGEEHRLSNREQELLKFLIEHRGAVVTRETLLTSIWNYNAKATTRTVDTHILNVRAKLGDDAGSPRFIETLYGIGYRFLAQEG